jgi:hypothetical protein
MTRIPIVIYAAKSADDVQGSIPAQIADCEAMAEREGTFENSVMTAR